MVATIKSTTRNYGKDLINGFDAMIIERKQRKKERMKSLYIELYTYDSMYTHI